MDRVLLETVASSLVVDGVPPVVRASLGRISDHEEEEGLLPDNFFEAVVPQEHFVNVYNYMARCKEWTSSNKRWVRDVRYVSTIGSVLSSEYCSRHSSQTSVSCTTTKTVRSCLLETDSLDAPNIRIVTETTLDAPLPSNNDSYIEMERIKKKSFSFNARSLPGTTWTFEFGISWKGTCPNDLKSVVPVYRMNLVMTRACANGDSWEKPTMESALPLAHTFLEKVRDIVDITRRCKLSIYESKSLFDSA